MKKYVLLESKNDSSPRTIGGLLVFYETDVATVVSSVLLQEGYGCKYFVSLDGTSKNLKEILLFQQLAPFEPDTPPYVYRLEGLKLSESA